MTDYERLRALAQATTPGPWTRERNGIDGPNCAEVITGGPVDCMSYCYGGTSTIEWERPADAEFIAAANPTVVLTLLDEIRALRMTRAKYDELESRRSDELTAAMSAGWEECADRVADHGMSDYAADLRSENPYWDEERDYRGFPTK